MKRKSPGKLNKNNRDIKPQRCRSHEDFMQRWGKVYPDGFPTMVGSTVFISYYYTATICLSTIWANTPF